MKAWWAVCLLSGGCAQLAGIDDTSGDGRKGLSLAVERISIGTTIVRTPQDLSASTATYLIADPADPAVVTPVEAFEREPGTWSADVFDATPPIVFELPENPGPIFQRQLALPTKNLAISFDVLEHPNPTPGPLTDTIAINGALDTPVVAGDSFEIFIVGTWTSRVLEPPVVNSSTLAPPAFPIGAMTSLTGRPHETITIDDTPLVIRRNGTRLTGLLEAAPFVQGTANTIMGQLPSVVADRTLTATIDQAAAIARLGVVRPAITTGPAFSFDLTAAPAGELGIAAGPRLISGAPAAGDATLSAAYGNPFGTKNWPTILSYSAAGSRSLVPTGETLPVTLVAGMQQVVSEPAAGVVLDFPVAVPEQVSIGGTSLSLDNVSLPQPTAPIEVTMVVDAANVTLYQLEVRELVPNMAATALDPVRTLIAVSREPSFTLQPEVFTPGKLYSLRVQTIRGLFTGDLDAGDLRTRTLPFATAVVDVGIFRVLP